MPASNGQPVQTLEAQDKQPTINEPSMEDILASIRRIIAADQTGGAMRNGLMASSSRDGAAVPQTAASGEPSRKEQAGPVAPTAIPDVEDASEETWDVTAHEQQLTPADDLKDEIASPMKAEEGHLSSVPHSPAGSDGERPYAAGRHEGIFPKAPDWSTPGDVYDAGPAHADDPAEPLLSDSVGASVSSSFQALANTVLMQDPEMIERMTREALRPMLKAWLDENLPSMVERLVRSEIERVARGGRSRD